jgi:hypothetical protein
MFQLTLQFVSERLLRLWMPPPTHDHPVIEFPLMLQYVMVRLPELKMPPPPSVCCHP